MNIGLIASSRHPIREPFAGGMEAHTHALATSLRERGHDVTVYASQDSDPELGVEPVGAARPVLSDAARADQSMVAESFVSDHHAYLSLMLGLRDGAHDVIHNNSLHYLPIAMADAVPAPVVTTLHTPPTPWMESAIQCAGPALRFAGVSRFTARSWRHAVSARVIHNGIDLERWPFVAEPAGGYVCWSGRMVPEKGPHLAIEAANRAGVRLRMAGPVSDAAYYEREVAPRLRDTAHEHVGHLGRAALAELVGGADVALFTPCWDEPYGLVVAEALACGTPAVSFDRGAFTEIVDERCGRAVPAGDVDAMARAIGAARRSVDRAACRARAERHCSLEAMVAAYLDFYADARASAPGGVRAGFPRRGGSA